MLHRQHNDPQNKIGRLGKQPHGQQNPCGHTHTNHRIEPQATGQKISGPRQRFMPRIKHWPLPRQVVGESTVHRRIPRAFHSRPILARSRRRPQQIQRPRRPRLQLGSFLTDRIHRCHRRGRTVGLHACRLHRLHTQQLGMGLLHDLIQPQHGPMPRRVHGSRLAAGVQYPPVILAVRFRINGRIQLGRRVFLGGRRRRELGEQIQPQLRAAQQTPNDDQRQQ